MTLDAERAALNARVLEASVRLDAAEDAVEVQRAAFDQARAAYDAHLRGETPWYCRANVQTAEFKAYCELPRDHAGAHMDLMRSFSFAVEGSPS